MKIQQNSDDSFEEHSTVTVFSDQDIENLQALHTPNIFEITYVRIGQGQLIFGEYSHTVGRGDIVLTGPDLQQDIPFKKGLTALSVYRVRFHASCGWRQFMSLPENAWMNNLLQLASTAVFIKGGNYRNLEKTFRQMLTHPKEISALLFLKYLLEVFELQRKSGITTIASAHQTQNIILQ